jgi:hypothetical protein
MHLIYSTQYSKITCRIVPGHDSSDEDVPAACYVTVSGSLWLEASSVHPCRAWGGMQGRILKYAALPEGGGKVSMTDVPTKEGPPKVTSFRLTLNVFKSPPESGNETPEVKPTVRPGAPPTTP